MTEPDATRDDDALRREVRSWIAENWDDTLTVREWWRRLADSGWGHPTWGEGTFDKALTVGFEHGGRAWARGHDAVGLAAGFVHTSSEWAQATSLDASLVGFAAHGNEQIIEAYYRWKLSDHLELTPDLQWIRRAGGNGDAPAFMAVGLRAAVGF